MRKTKIVCTIGPASESIEMLTKLMESGMNVARLNFSHGDFEEHGARIKISAKQVKNLARTLEFCLIQKVLKSAHIQWKTAVLSLKQAKSSLFQWTRL